MGLASGPAPVTRMPIAVRILKSANRSARIAAVAGRNAAQQVDATRLDVGQRWRLDYRSLAAVSPSAAAPLSAAADCFPRSAQ